MPAQATANSVIASAKRLIDVRHFCWKQQQDGRDQRAGVADADPPDEVDDVEAPADRDVVAPDADALGSSRSADDQQQQHRAARSAMREADEPALRRAPRAATIALIVVGDRRRRCGPARRPAVADGCWRRRARVAHQCCSLSHAPCASPCGRRRVGRQLGVRVAHRAPGTSCAAACSSSCEQAVVARLGLAAARPRLLGIVEVAEDDRLGRAGLLAGGQRSRRRGSARSSTLGLDARAR